MSKTLQIGEVNLVHLEEGYNSAGRNERTIEIPLGQAFLRAHSKVVEVGAVLPYYQDCDHIIVDETDNKATVFADAMNYDGFQGRSVLSISTLEHMGTGKYGGKVETHMPKYFLERILKEAKHYLITMPIGYTEYADHLVKTWDNLGKISVIYLARDAENQWYVTDDTAWAFDYDKPYKWANAIAVITNWPPLLKAAPADAPKHDGPDEQELDLTGMSVKEVTELVEAGQLNASDALEAEKAGKNRKSLIKKLEVLSEVEVELPVVELEPEPEVVGMEVVALDPVSAADVAAWETQDDPQPEDEDTVSVDYIDVPEEDEIPW